MALKDTWVGKVNGEDDVNAEDINSIAQAVIDLEEEFADTTEGGGADLSDDAPLMNGEESPGTSEEASRADHVHPTDTSRMPSADQMGVITNPANADTVLVHSREDGQMKKLLWGRMLLLIKEAITSVASATTAESLTDPVTGYKATLPELESDNGVILLERDLAEHNTSPDAHNDIRLLIDGIAQRLNAIADSDDTTLDQLSELVAYIKDNRELIEQITTGKVSVTDIVNNLTTNVTDKPLSAAQGVALKALIDAIKVPTKLSELTGDATHRTVTDEEKAAWDAKSDFSGKYADLSGKPTIPTVPTNVSAFNNDVGYLTDAELDAAVDAALTEAKESGEFDGAPGTSPTVAVEGIDGGHRITITDTNGTKAVDVLDGKPGRGIKSVSRTSGTGAAGTTDTYTITYTDNTTSTFGVYNGKDGYTPVKGKDYFTPAEIEDIVQQVITALGTPVFGRVDEENNIILTGNLVDGTYTFKYEDAEGNQTTIGTLTTEAAPSYTNVLPLAINADGTPYNGGQGWKTDTRLNSSGIESTSSATGIEVTGFIPAKNGDVLYLKDVILNMAHDPDSTYIWLYNSSFAKLGGRYIRLGDISETTFQDRISRGLIKTDSDGNWIEIVIDGNVLFKQSTSQDSMDDVAYIRFSCHEITADSIVTVNEPIS